MLDTQCHVLVYAIVPVATIMRRRIVSNGYESKPDETVMNHPNANLLTKDDGEIVALRVS